MEPINRSSINKTREFTGLDSEIISYWRET